MLCCYSTLTHNFHFIHYGTWPNCTVGMSLMRHLDFCFKLKHFFDWSLASCCSLRHSPLWKYFLALLLSCNYTMADGSFNALLQCYSMLQALSFYFEATGLFNCDRMRHLSIWVSKYWASAANMSNGSIRSVCLIISYKVSPLLPL
jgi:hypothetical protein